MYAYTQCDRGFAVNAATWIVQNAALTRNHKVHEQKHSVLDLEDAEIKFSIVPDAKIQQLHPIITDARY